MGFLFFMYLVAVGFLSAVSLHESHANSQTSKVYTNQKKEDPSKGGIQYGIMSYRRSKKFRIDWCAPLQYLNPPKEPVALVSFPGSGNTWLRYLLQQATGLYTGSVYKDYGLLKTGFPAESISNGSVLVVKTHEWGENVRKSFSKAILLVRAPGPAIQAEFNRQNGGHVGFASIDRYTRTRGKYWRHFVSDKLTIWKKMNLDWLYNFTGPTHVVFYETLVDNVEYTLKQLLTFLDAPMSENLLKCALARREGIYKRKSRTLDFDHYTIQMRKQLKIEEQAMYEAIQGTRKKLKTPSELNSLE